MKEKIEIELSNKTKEKLYFMADQAGIALSKLCEVLLDSFVENDGKIYVGKWKEGPGVRILPDWPRFSSSVIKVKIGGENE